MLVVLEIAVTRSPVATVVDLLHRAFLRFQVHENMRSTAAVVMQHSCGVEVSRPQCWDPISSCRLSETGVSPRRGFAPRSPLGLPARRGEPGPVLPVWFGGPGSEMLGSLLPSPRCPHRQVAEVPVRVRGTTARGYANSSLRRTSRRGSGIECRGEPAGLAGDSFPLLPARGRFTEWPRDFLGPTLGLPCGRHHEPRFPTPLPSPLAFLRSLQPPRFVFVCLAQLCRRRLAESLFWASLSPYLYQLTMVAQVLGSVCC